MEIDMIGSHLFNKIEQALNRYLRSWYLLPSYIDLDLLYIERIRLIDCWEVGNQKELAYIIEYAGDDEVLHCILSESELKFTIVEHKLLMENEEYQNKKDYYSNNYWYQYPVVYGPLDNTYDSIDNY